MTPVARPLGLSIALLVLACPAVAGEPADRLDRLVEWLTGTFSSAVQADRDPAFEDVTLYVARVWRDREDGAWLYLEQSLASAPGRPYRQRILHVMHVGRDLYECRTLELPDPGAAIGAWSDPKLLEPVDPEVLDERTGCEVVLRDLGDAFVGGTLARLCTSSRAGAEYATSQVRLGPDGLDTWDRGWTGEGVQVWGAERGPYRLRRVAPRAGAPSGDDADGG